MNSREVIDARERFEQRRRIPSAPLGEAATGRVIQLVYQGGTSPDRNVFLGASHIIAVLYSRGDAAEADWLEEICADRANEGASADEIREIAQQYLEMIDGTSSKKHPHTLTT